MKPFRYITIILISLFLLFLAKELVNTFNYSKQLYKSGKYLVYPVSSQNVLGTSSDGYTISAKFDTSSIQGSPSIFGGAQMPYLEHGDIWDKLANIGVTMVRKDFFLEYTLPTNISLQDYMSNKNSISDPSKWRTKNIEYTKDSYHAAKQRGMKVMGILSYAPKWLTYTGTQYGVPRNWDVYEDILKKLYRIYRDDLDYLEVWNEPSYRIFLDPSGSGLSREEAYAQLVFHAIKAIRSVDSEINDGKNIYIGVQVNHKSDDFSIAEYLFQKTDIRENIQFLSIHHYGVDSPDIGAWKTFLAKYNKSSLPLFVSEWNYTHEVKNNLPELTQEQSIPYTGKMLLSFMNNGLFGANYYSLFPLDKELRTPGHGYLAFYDWNNSTAQLLPQSKTWELLSKVLGLGNGISTIYSINAENSIPATVFKNAKGEQGLILVNENGYSKKYVINVTGLNKGKYYSIHSYLADKTSTPSTIVSTTVVKNFQSIVDFSVLIPSYSIVALTFEESGQIQYTFDELLRGLYVRS